MKKLIYVVVAALLIVATGCKKTESGNPELSLNITSISAPADGMEASILFEVKNGVAGESVSVEYPSECSWIYGLEYDKSDKGNISFKIQKSYEGVSRSVDMVVSYPGVESVVVKISQEAGTPLPFTITIKEVTPTNIRAEVSAKDAGVSYIAMVSTKSSMEEEGLYIDDDALFQDDMEYFNYLADLYERSIEEQMTHHIHTGVYTLDYFARQDGKEYVVYAYGIDPQTLERTTDIMRVDVMTEKQQMIDAKFDINVEMDGCDVFVKLNTQHNGYYYMMVMECSYFDNFPGMTQEEVVRDIWVTNLYNYTVAYGMTLSQFIAMYCKSGSTLEAQYSAKASTDHVVIAFAVDDQTGLPCSELSKEYFTTFTPDPSDIQIKLTVSDITAYSVHVKVEPSNNDPYTAGIYPADRVDGKSEDEIFQYMSTESYLKEIQGGFEESMSGLEANTDYYVIACGYKGGVRTSSLFKVPFTTKEASTADIQVNVDCSKYWSMKELAEADPYFKDFTEDAVVLVQSSLEPEGTEGTIYFAILVANSIIGDTDESNVDYLLGNGPSEEMELYTLDFDVEYVAISIASDNDGNLGKLRYQYFTLKESGVNHNVDELLGMLQSPAKVFSADVMESFKSASLKKNNQKMLHKFAF